MRLGNTVLLSIAVAVLAAGVLAGRACAADPAPSPELEQELEEAQARIGQLERRLRTARGRIRDYGRWVRKLQREARLIRRQAQVGYQVDAALEVMCVVYPGHCSTGRRKIRCESGNWPYAKNRSSSASGLGQFLDSTWASTPFAGVSVFNPYANALAVGWMHEHNRGGEWVCK